MVCKFSISTNYFRDLSPEEGVQELAAAGLQYGELGVGHTQKMLSREGCAEKLGRDLAACAADRGVQFLQGHLDMALDLCQKEDHDQLKRSLELYHGLGVRSAVIHATGANDLPLEQQLAVRGKALAELVAHISGTDMTICVENLFANAMTRDADGILSLLEAAGGSQQLGVCLDIGHLHRTRSRGMITQTAREFIQKAGSRLKALHIHDNMGVADDHLLPFVDKGLDWKEFMLALQESGYDRLFNMELPAVSHAPMAVRRQKLAYAIWLGEYLHSGQFLEN